MTEIRVTLLLNSCEEYSYSRNYSLAPGAGLGVDLLAFQPKDGLHNPTKPMDLAKDLSRATLPIAKLSSDLARSGAVLF